MSATVTVSLSDELKRDLDEVAKEEGGTPSDIVRRSVADYVFFRRFNALCAELAAEARAKGIHTEEDVHKLIGTGR